MQTQDCDGVGTLESCGLLESDTYANNSFIRFSDVLTYANFKFKLSSNSRRKSGWYFPQPNDGSQSRYLPPFILAYTCTKYRSDTDHTWTTDQRWNRAINSHFGLAAVLVSSDLIHKAFWRKTFSLRWTYQHTASSSPLPPSSFFPTHLDALFPAVSFRKPKSISGSLPHVVRFVRNRLCQKKAKKNLWELWQWTKASTSTAIVVKTAIRS